MLQVLKIFLIFSLLPSLSFAWNSSCYSPVQMAAFMSKPKKSSRGVSQSSVSRVKAKIRSLEKALDKAEGDLQDSLDKDKLKAKTSSVAGDIRNYIENKQDGWDCAESGQSSLFFFPSLIPQAYAQSVVEDTIEQGSETEDETSLPVVEESETETNQQVVTGTTEGKTDFADDAQVINRNTAGKASPADDAQVINRNTSGKAGSADDAQVSERQKSPIEKCLEKTGFVWKDGKCLSPEQIEREKCEERAGKWQWQGNKCECPAPYKKDGNKCREKTEEEICLGKKFKWVNGKCLSPKAGSADNAQMSERQKSPREKCLAKTGFVWRGEKCLSPEQIERENCLKQSGMEWIGGECKKTPKSQCEERENWQWKSNKCECPSPYKKDGNKCREKTEEEKCLGKNFKWLNGKCLSPGRLSQINCEKRSGMEWIGGECKKTPKSQCEERAGNWQWKGNKCECPAPYKKDGNNCREKTDMEKCDEKPGNWTWNRTTCICPKGSKQDGEICASKTKEDDCKEKGEDWTWKNDKCEECPKWKKHSAFKSNGMVSSGFCDDYAKDKGDCKSALSDLREYAVDLRDLQNQLDDLKDALREKSRQGYEDESKTEADGVCFDCLKRIIRSSQPSTGQVIGQSLSLLMGAGISVAGYKAGQNAQRHANMMRVRQGYPGLYDGFSLTGAGAGFPFMANSLYGLTRAGTPAGGWACSPTVSPYGHTFNAGYGYGHNMRYYR